MADDGVPKEAPYDHHCIRGRLSGLRHERALKPVSRFPSEVALKICEASRAA